MVCATLGPGAVKLEPESVLNSHDEKSVSGGMACATLGPDVMSTGPEAANYGSKAAKIWARGHF
jgi:hypothetical protein